VVNCEHTDKLIYRIAKIFLLKLILRFRNICKVFHYRLNMGSGERVKTREDFGPDEHT